jgi:hypothetical protein
MISVKIASIIAIAAFATGSFFAPPVQQAIAAVIATDVQCTGCVGTADLAGNAITAAKVKDGEIKAAEIATDAVGAAELAGLTKFIFGQCNPSSIVGIIFSADASATAPCNISGVDTDDSIIVTLDGNANFCFGADSAHIATNNVVSVLIRNHCPATQTFQSGSSIGIMVYDK